jgi:hypothetical protein
MMGEIEQYVSNCNDDKIYIDEFNFDYSQLELQRACTYNYAELTQLLELQGACTYNYAELSVSRPNLLNPFKIDVGVVSDSDTDDDDDDDELPALIAIDSDSYDYHAVHSRCTSFKTDVDVVPDFILIDSDTDDDVNDDHVAQCVYGDNHAVHSDSKCTFFKPNVDEMDLTSFTQDSDKVNKRFPWYFVHQNNVHNYEDVTRLTEAVKDLSKSIEGRLQTIDKLIV